MLGHRFSHLSVLIIAIGLLFCFNTSQASHIVGGEMTYRLNHFNFFNNTSTYIFELKLYRDQGGIPFDQNISIGVYEEVQEGVWDVFTIVENISLSEVSYIQAPRDVCTDDMLSPIEIESGIYAFEVQIPHTSNNFMVSYQKCCRNHSINNITFPGQTGAVYDVIIEGTDTAIINSSPRFNENPTTFICLNDQLNIDHSAFDPDGDELRYKFCKPSVGGGTMQSTPTCCNCQTPNPSFCPPPYQTVGYNTNYSEDQPLGISAGMEIDPITGVITGSPKQLGSYVLGICVEEYRNGELIGEIRRDFEVNVTFCAPILEARIEADTFIQEQYGDFVKDYYKIHTCSSDSINLINDTDKEQFIEEYEWKLFDENNILLEHYKGENNRDFNITTLPKLSGVNLKGYMVINPESSCPDTADFLIHIADQVEPTFEYDYDPCERGSLYLENTTSVDKNEYDWFWFFNESQVANREDAIYRPFETGEHDVMLLAVDDHNCSFEGKSTVTWTPIEDYDGPDYLQLDSTICYGESIEINNQMITIDGQYQETLISAVTGCDSIIIDYEITLAAQAIELQESINICDQDSIMIDNHWVKQEGIYIESIKSEMSDCDSIIKTIELSVLDNLIFEEKDTLICFGESVRFKGEDYYSTGQYIYSENYINQECDSLVSVLNLVVTEDPEYQQLDTIICDDINFKFLGKEIMEDGVYDGYIPFTTSDCDSIYKVLFVESRQTPIINNAQTIIADPGREYQIELEIQGEYTKIEWSPSFGLSCSDCVNPKVKLRQEQEYTVKVFNSDQCLSSKSIKVELTDVIDFYVPNIMHTQGGLSQNNRLFVQCFDELEYTYDMQVYDRLGNKIFAAYNLAVNQKEGAWTADNLNPGVFVYDIQFHNNINPKRLTGEILIIK